MDSFNDNFKAKKEGWHDQFLGIQTKKIQNTLHANLNLEI